MILFGLRFVVRAIGLVSTMVTARLLTPADFGIIGTASLVSGFFAVLQSSGAGDGLIRLRQIENSHVETAWTINVIVCAVTTAGLWAVAPWAAGVLQEPRLTDVLRVLCFTPLIGSLSSPGSSRFLRDLQFRREFGFRVIQKVMAVACTLVGALVVRNYWGLVYGMMVGSISFTLVSYVLYPYRPRLHLRHLDDFLGFSLWSFAQGLASYVATTIDEVVVRRIAPTELFGLYHTSRDLSRVLVSEFVAPAASALLPGLARLQDEKPRFLRAAQSAIGVAAIVSVACGLGVSATAEEVTGLLLGPRWAGAAPYLALTALGGMGQTLAGLHRGILAAMNRADWSALLWILRAAVLLVCCAAAGALGGPIAVATTFAVVSVVLTVFDYTVIFTRLGRPSAVIEVFAAPVLAGLGMSLALAALPLPASTPLIVSAVAKIGVGGLVYGGILLGLWWARGRPDGAETALLHRLPPAFGHRLLPRARPPGAG